MRNIRYMRAAVPIRTIMMALLVMVLLIFPLILAVGSYDQTNNVPLNGTIGLQYNAIVGNESNPSATPLFGAYYSLTSQGPAQGSQLHNSNLNFGLFNTVGLVSQFFTSLLPITYGILNFISIPLQAIGVPTWFAITIMASILILLLVLAVVSAIALFPL
jgi:hypothetical protein